MECEVTIQLGGQDIPCGRLYTNARRGVESATFSYDPNYLRRDDAFALSSDLPLSEGSIHTAGKALFDAFEDCMPDRWGRNLMLRSERLDARRQSRAARTLFEGDMLAAVSDFARQGALRIWVDGTSVAEPEFGVPREVDLPRLLAQADLAAEDMDADIRDLFQAGSSLGGARPKASVVDETGELHIAKFPKPDESPLDDICAWEYVALALAERCGISTPEARIVRIAGRSLLLTKRFDRRGSERVPFMSGLAAIGGVDGGTYSYLELVDFLEREGADPSADIRQLWKRILFSCAIGNTDDHMRNHGFLRLGGGWRLSAAYDVNPTAGDNQKYLRCAIDFDERRANPECALDACEYFRFTRKEAIHEAHDMASKITSWHRIASSAGITAASMDRMRSSFEAGIDRLKRL